jgi:predicted DsbA family dithiol-disulfide isomerase
VARAAHKMALESPRIRADVVEISEFPRLAQRYQVRAVPTTVFNDQVLVTGAMNEEALLEQIVKVLESGGLASGPGQTGASTPSATDSEPPRPPGLILP